MQAGAFASTKQAVCCSLHAWLKDALLASRVLTASASPAYLGAALISACVIIDQRERVGGGCTRASAEHAAEAPTSRHHATLSAHLGLNAFLSIAITISMKNGVLTRVRTTRSGVYARNPHARHGNSTDQRLSC